MFFAVEGRKDNMAYTIMRLGEKAKGIECVKRLLDREIYDDVAKRMLGRTLFCYDCSPEIPDAKMHGAELLKNSSESSDCELAQEYFYKRGMYEDAYQCHASTPWLGLLYFYGRGGAGPDRRRSEELLENAPLTPDFAFEKAELEMLKYDPQGSLIGKLQKVLPMYQMVDGENRGAAEKRIEIISRLIEKYNALPPRERSNKFYWRDCYDNYLGECYEEDLPKGRLLYGVAQSDNQMIMLGNFPSIYKWWESDVPGHRLKITFGYYDSKYHWEEINR